MTQIYLVRHAHADWRNDDNRSLSPAGFAAAARLAERLSVLPISAIYSSTHRRAIETVTPLANRRGISVQLIRDLRERELPVVPAGTFEQTVESSWSAPDRTIAGGESNLAAQTRAVAVVRTVIANHPSEHVVVATHGNLLALILNAFDSRYGYAFWRQLSFPDIYHLEFRDAALIGVQRMWDDHHGNENTRD